MEPDDSSCELCCPLCGGLQDAFDLYTENAGRDGASCCLHCGEEVSDEDWIHN